MDWFLYDNGLRYERVNQHNFQKPTELQGKRPTIQWRIYDLIKIL